MSKVELTSDQLEVLLDAISLYRENPLSDDIREDAEVVAEQFLALQKRFENCGYTALEETIEIWAS